MCLYRQTIYGCGHSQTEQLRDCGRVRDQLYRINEPRYRARPNYLPFNWPAACRPGHGNVCTERRPMMICRRCASGVGSGGGGGGGGVGGMGGGFHHGYSPAAMAGAARAGAAVAARGFGAMGGAGTGIRGGGGEARGGWRWLGYGGWT